MIFMIFFALALTIEQKRRIYPKNVTGRYCTSAQEK